MPFDQVNFDLAIETDEVVQKLSQARALLTDPSRWAQGDYCVGDAYCALGAIRAVYGPGTLDATPACNYLYEFSWETTGKSAHSFNDADETTHADVLALFDGAISARRGELS